MKINKITLKNFKFYVQETIKTDNKNILLYGENGTGKSSLYWALHLFYKTLFSTSQHLLLKKLDKDESSNLVNHNLNQDAELIIKINGRNLTLNKTSITNNSIHNNSYKTFHFLNHHKLSTLVTNKYNIYDIIENDFFDKYTLFDNLKLKLASTESNLINSQDTTQLNSELNETLTQLSRRVNVLLKRVFKENLNISFIIEDNFFANTTTSGQIELEKPTIYININSFSDFHLRINEARIKIVAITIYLSLFIHNEKMINTPNLLKVIVLDDILLSLDMSQRANIMKFIFRMFYDEYQFFVFTHDIYFYDMTKKAIKFHENEEDFNLVNWGSRIVFNKLNHLNFYEAAIFSTQENYLDDAEIFLQQNNLSECGNNIRKEMERIIKSFLIYFEIGNHGLLNANIKILTNLRNKNLYDKPHKILDDIFDEIHNPLLTDQQKIQRIDQLFTNHVHINLNNLNKILKDFQWHRDIVGNASSHAGVTSQYRTEFTQAIEDVKKIKRLYKNQLKI